MPKKSARVSNATRVKEIAVADMKVHVLSTGVMETDLTRLLRKGAGRRHATPKPIAKESDSA